MSEPSLAREGSSAVAVIGLAGRFPGARDVAQLWRNLRDGAESISRLEDGQLRAAGVSPELFDDPAYVKAAALLADADCFDAPLFGYSPAEAEMLDPQHRVFLECCWEALENAGYDPDRYPGLIGVYAGCSASTYLLAALPGGDPSRLEAGALAARLAGEKDFLALRVSYKLNLRGPSVCVQTACSTSLVAVHLACQSLLDGECDVALAGGVAVKVPQEVGYLHEPGGILSPDGHCRPFDARAQGTLYGSGAGVVVLKRLAEALADRDSVYAVIRGSAINNDGAAKLGFAAPSVAGQARVFAEACATAGIEPDQLDYIEAHGTGTPLGDPIEVEALTQVLRATTGRKGFCGLGSLKSNFGHLDVAAGVAGLIKTVLALANREIPPTLHFESPNPRLGLADSPFYVTAERRPWPAASGPCRAGVSSFGIGGTNAHVVLEEAPPPPPRPAPARRWQLIAFSARTPEALATYGDRLHVRFQESPAPELADAAFTLLVGRRGLRHRRIVVGESLADVGAALAGEDPRRVLTGVAASGQQSVAFLFPGQGSQHAGMGLEIYRHEEVFRTEVDRCCEMLIPHLGLDLRTVLYPPVGEPGPLDETWLAQPALFVVEHALARLWAHWGIQPAVMLGHSLGEYVAACLAGVFELPDALTLVAARGRLMQRLPRGAMLAVQLPETAVRELLDGQLALAAVNGPQRTVISGPEEEVAALAARLREEGVASRRLRTSHAFHSPAAEPVLAEFRRHVRSVERRPPALRYLSSLTGTWITPEEAVDPDYWVRQSRAPVQMWKALQELQRRRRILLEVGPGHTLSVLARQVAREEPVVTSLPRPEAGRPAAAHLLEALGRLWLAGVEVDWQAYFAREQRRRIALPAYPFERRRYWLGAPHPALGPSAPPKAAARPIAEWFSIPSWKRTLVPSAAAAAEGETWLLLGDADTPGAALGERLRSAGCQVVRVEAGDRFARCEPGGYLLRPGFREDFAALFADLRRRGALPRRIVHTWCLGEPGIPADRDLEPGFFSLLSLAQTLGEQDLAWPLELVVLSSGIHRVTGEETLSPRRATVIGPVRVIPFEYPQVVCRNVDCLPPAAGSAGEEWLAPLVRELLSGGKEPVVACRRVDRWVPEYEPVRLEAAAAGRLRAGGVCLITGGLGGIGLALAEHLAATAGARLVLTGREGLPPREQRDALEAASDTSGELRRRIAAVRGLEAGGAQVLTAAVDVTDRTAMAALLSEVQRRWGGPHAVIHCAGQPGGGMIQGRSREVAARVLAPKVEGTLVLDELLAGRELDFFVVCSSLTALWGGIGQVDYCAANAFLGCFAQSRAAAGGRFTLAIEWGSWSEVGMAARAEQRTALGAADPFLPETVMDTPDLKVCRHRLDGGHWLVAEHRFDGVGLLPGTAYLEFARVAFVRLAGAGAVEIAEVVVGHPLRVSASGRLVYTALQPEGEGFRFSILSPPDGGDPDWHEHATGRIAPWQPDAVARADFGRLCRDFSLREAAPQGLRPSDAQGPLHFGPRWDCLKKVQVGSRAALAEIELAGAFAGDLATTGLHPALLDVALAFASPAAGGALYAPLGYDRVRVLRPLPRRFCSWVSHRAQEGAGETQLFDAQLLDPAGERLAEVDGFMLRRVERREELLAPQHRRSTVASPAGRAAMAALAGVHPAVGEPEGSPAWIPPAAGVEAFARALACPFLPQVAVSPLPLDVIRPTAADPGRVPASGPVALVRAPRPALATAYVPPEGELERRLARLWEELFGIEPVGREDDFFELGGDSVLGLRLVAQARKLGLELAANQIFQSSTIARLAAAGQRAPTVAAATAAPAAAAGRGGYRPEDFATAALTQEELDELISEYDPGAEARA